MVPQVSYKGSFKNDMDKMRWVGGQNMSIVVHIQRKTIYMSRYSKNSRIIFR